MNSKLLVQISVLVTTIVFAIGIWFTEETFNITWLRFFSASVPVVMLVFGLWEYYLWQLQIIQKFFRVPRDIRGTWQGKLDSFWKDPKTNESIKNKKAYLVVKQSAFHVSILLLTNESKSISTLANIFDDNISYSLNYIYLNKPHSRFEGRSRIHHGSASLDIVGTPAKRLYGRYWTDRDSRGELDFNHRNTKIVNDFHEAEILFDDNSS